MVSIHGSGINIVIVVIYRPGSQQADTTFFEGFSDLGERVAAMSAPVIMLGDINIRIDDASLSSTSNFMDIVTGCGMQQLVTEPTHRAGHTLDVVIVHNTTSATVVVEPPVISGHSVITVTVDLVSARETSTVTVTKRNWSKLKVEVLESELRASDLLMSPRMTLIDSLNVMKTVSVGSSINMHL